MNGNAYRRFLLPSVSFTSISIMIYLIQEDTKRQFKNEFIQNEETSDIILSTYVGPYVRNYGYTYVNPTKINEKIMPAVNDNFDINTGLTMTNLEDNVYRDNKCDLVSFTKFIKNENFVYQDSYDKLLNYFE